MTGGGGGIRTLVGPEARMVFETAKTPGFQGCENHELPMIDGNATEVLVPNMVVTIEPSVIVRTSERA
jgi:hypothetical protein